jgi:hypothetical protein
MSERSERIDITVHFAQWCTLSSDAPHTRMVHQ